VAGRERAGVANRHYHPCSRVRCTRSTLYRVFEMNRTGAPLSRLDDTSLHRTAPTHRRDNGYDLRVFVIDRGEVAKGSKTSLRRRRRLLIPFAVWNAFGRGRRLVPGLDQSRGAVRFMPI